MKVTNDSYTIIAAKHELAEAYKTSYLETQKALGGVLQADSLNLRNNYSRIDRAFKDSDLHKIILRTNFKPYGESLEDFMQLISHDKAYISNLAVVEAASEMGYYELRIVASGDNVCKYCKSMDGKIIKAEDDSNIPPFHPNCNCTVVPISIHWLNDNPYVYGKTQGNKFIGPVRSTNIQYDVTAMRKYVTHKDTQKYETGVRYVTSSQLKAFGWKNASEQEVSKLNAALKKYGITNNKSIVLFLATCGHESGKGSWEIEQGKDSYFESKDYKKTGRGAGYIQITWKETHLKFLKTVDDAFSDSDTATYIAENYPWEAACWFWSSKEAKSTSAGSLNDYATKYGGSIGVFLITQYLVNSWPKGLENNIAVSIRDGKVSWEMKNGMLYVNGKEICEAPLGWEDRERNYYDITKIFN